ncbi:MAG: YitT family protein [Lachnospiraceae bacterium]|nr:YitT family protein [Lachnospiraceae bacterium]
MKFNLKKDGLRILGVVAAALLMAFNLKAFVHVGGLYPGGATGLSVLIQRAAERYLSWHLPYTPINLLLNAIPIYIGFRYIGKKFTLFSMIQIVCTSIFTDLLPSVTITEDPFLIAIFGGIILGFVISVCLRLNATTGGTDFIAIYLSQKRGLDSFNVILAINAVILITAGLMFGLDKAMYSIVYQFVSTQVLHMLYRKYRQGTLLVVTTKPQEVADEIYRVCGHGATILEGEGSHEHTEKKVIYSVVSAAQTDQAVSTVKKVDPDAFVNVIRTEKISGRFYVEPEE